MEMHPLFGHSAARRRLAAGVRSGRLPQVVLITGPEGVGKQRLALWLAQLILCSGPGEEPCGECRACRLVLTLSHADLHWIIPIPRPKSGDPDKQVEEAAELLAEAVGARRENPVYGPVDGMAFHPLASAKLLQRRAFLTPVEGRWKIFVLAEADRLVPQEASPDAANALLKLLEEPPADTVLLLTATEPERVLPTIRSRAVPLRLAPLPDSLVRDFAEQVLESNGKRPDLEAMVRRAEGSIGKMVVAGEKAGGLADEARAALKAFEDGGAASYERSLKQAPWSARGGFTDLLDAMADELMARARASADPKVATALTGALRRVEAARTEAQGNVNPQLLLASLADELAEVL